MTTGDAERPLLKSLDDMTHQNEKLLRLLPFSPTQQQRAVLQSLDEQAGKQDWMLKKDHGTGGTTLALAKAVHDLHTKATKILVVAPTKQSAVGLWRRAVDLVPPDSVDLSTDCREGRPCRIFTKKSSIEFTDAHTPLPRCRFGWILLDEFTFQMSVWIGTMSMTDSRVVISSEQEGSFFNELWDTPNLAVRCELKREVVHLSLDEFCESRPDGLSEFDKSLLRLNIAAHLGYDRDPTMWSDEERSDIEDVMEQGVRMYEAPLVRIETREDGEYAVFPDGTELKVAHFLRGESESSPVADGKTWRDREPLL